MTNEYTIQCCGCSYTADFDNPATAISAANMHVDLGREHVVTTTRPAHHHPGSVPVIVAITNPEKQPRTMIYTTDMETYRVKNGR